MIDGGPGGGSQRPVAAWLACMGVVLFGCATTQNAPPLRLERQTIDVAVPAGPFSVANPGFGGPFGAHAGAVELKKLLVRHG